MNKYMTPMTQEMSPEELQEYLGLNASSAPNMSIDPDLAPIEPSAPVTPPPSAPIKPSEESSSMFGNGLGQGIGTALMALGAGVRGGDANAVIQNHITRSQDEKHKQQQLVKDYLAKKYQTDQNTKNHEYKVRKDEQAQSNADRTFNANTAHQDRMYDLAKTKANKTGKAAEVKPNEYEKSLQKKYANAAADWTTTQRPSVMSDIQKLRDAEAQLEAAMQPSGENLSGSIMGRIPGQDFFNASGNNLKDSIASVTQKNLKDTLGGQFAQKEGEELIKRAYNPLADEKENLKRVRALRLAMEQAFENRDALTEQMSSGTKAKDVAANAVKAPAPQKKEVKRQKNKTTGKVRVVYDDGTTEEL